MYEEWLERELELLHEIDQLNQRIEELELHVQSRSAGFNENKIIVNANPSRNNPQEALGNLIAAGLFPIFAGILGRVYRLIFRLK